ncbi:regulator of G-protein signaling 14 isoform X1 [Girardinichthys multiradiatus]|uniref:regulator of G-protein signaling 14 isoform X1 n=1 Tax=Girardinichthys multiradiatus TaxID=208333 RepID=UPI001FAE5574|nr:regulator of G-protein signaling 14 isoform X1 [Girardinichthys multiradiatus]
MVAFSGLYHKFSRLASSVSLKQHRTFEKWRILACSNRKDIKSQAVSDGELNMSARGCGGSSSSLPGTPGGDVNPANSVLSWAVSFEKLLEDPCGVAYFTAFLKSEVSAENILFWQECEKFRKIPATSLDQLKAVARSIYNTYVSDSAPYCVNIDDTAKTEEKDLEQPTPDMFNKAQAQIFKLMKMDSYRRFVRSPLYQRCTLASVEGIHLPQLSTEPVSIGSWEDMVNRSPPSDKKNQKSNSNSLPVGKSASEKQRQERGSWGDASNRPGSGPLKESNMSINSTSSVELGSLCRQMENGRLSPSSRDQRAGIGSRMGMEGGYCCVYLPDGSASLAPTRNGQPIKDMLASLCEKRGFPLKDVIIYLHGKDKLPLSLDQDCSVLRDQQVSLELRVTFALENAFTGKTVGIKVKSSKTVQDALSAVLQKHHLKPQEAEVTMVGSDELVNLNCSVYRLANKKIRLDKAKGKDQTIIPRGAGLPSTQSRAVSAALEPRSSVHTERVRTQQRPSKNRDMDGFLDMLTRAQCCRVEDQRGLLTKEQLEIPLFLQVSSDQGQNTGDPSTTRSSTSDSKTESEDNKCTSAAAKKSEEDSKAPKSESKDLRETTV